MLVILKESPTLINVKPDLIAGKLLTKPLPVISFELIDQDKETFGVDQLNNKWTVLFFGYTNCPDVCPTTIYKLSEIYKNITKEKESLEDFQMILITLDPKRDTVERLKEYLSFFEPSLIGLTGSDNEIRKVTSNLSVYFEKVGEADEYDYNHTASIFLIGPEASVLATFSPASNSKDLTQDILNILL